MQCVVCCVGQLLVHKSLHSDEDYFSVDGSITVSHVVHNIGEGYVDLFNFSCLFDFYLALILIINVCRHAYEISVEDPWPEEHFETVGQSEFTLDVLAPYVCLPTSFPFLLLFQWLLMRLFVLYPCPCACVLVV